MAATNDVSRSFRLYVTHVDGEGHFLKISGQLDQQSSLMIESLFETARENLEKGIGAVHPSAIHEGVVCAAKYKDGTYYRAKIINTTNIANGLVGVHFIDYGNKDIISVSTIRFLDNYDPMFFQLRGQATDYYLSRIINPSGRWEEAVLLKLQSLLCYSDYTGTIDVQTQSLPLISIQFKGNDLSTHLVSFRFGIAIALTKQEVLLLQTSNENHQQPPNWQSNYANENPSYLEHVPFTINQNFPANPASAMRLQQNVALPYNSNLAAAQSLISQRLLVNKVARNTVNLKAPVRQPQHAPPSLQQSSGHQPVAAHPPQPPPAKPVSPKKSSTYKTKLLDVQSKHKVYVSFAEDGPELFAVQLAEDAMRLQEMMDDINRRPHTSLTQPPMIGTVCLGRMSGDRIICRAVVMNLSGSQCKLYFVDFGDTEMVSYYDIFDIPEEYVKPSVFALRFCLSGIKKLEKGPHVVEAFKQLVNEQMLTLRVVPPEGPPLIQYGELYLDNKNVLDLLLANMKDKLQFKWMEMLPLNTRHSVLVSYVDSCIKFYVQLSDKIDELNAVMDAVKYHCENSASPGELPVGAACCAQFPDDGNWYRALVKQSRKNKVVVSYVDYGNEQEVEVSALRTITPDLIRLPAQAMKCALKGFENKPVESKTSNQLEMLALEKTLMSHVVGVLSNDTMLVSLVDDTQAPPLDIARKMTQLSQPRSSHEPKVTTPVRKDAPESFSSPEGSMPDDSRKKSFKREKSFKDERRPPREGNEEFGQRGGSFRGRENRENFDRSGPGRHSEKYGGRPDRGDRNDRNERRGPKPWENNASPPAAQPSGDDDWEDTTAQNQQTQRNNRDNNYRDRDNRDNRRKPRDQINDKGTRPVWKKDSGPGKRLRQAAEAASADTQNVHKPTSIQDRLKRDKYNQSEEREERNDDWGNRTGRDNRPERRDNRGERRDNWNDKKDNWGEKKGEWGEKKNNWGEKKDNWGEKKDNWGEKKDNWGEKKDNYQKRDFRENSRSERSSFTPRERAERSFGSDDKRSERSYKSQDSARAGRAPPPRPRSKFTHVTYKELPEPAPLDSQYAQPPVEPDAQHEVSVTWIVSPANFYTQILAQQPKFLEMMHRIPELYKGVRPFAGAVAAGAAVLARYPADGVLYRAVVLSAQPFSKFVVRYVDFGNKQLVDSRDIWQLDRSLLELPAMAVHCALAGVAPAHADWRADADVDLCFNAPRYQCVFHGAADDRQRVSLWNNGVSVADMLVQKGLAVAADNQTAVTLKDEPIDMTIIVGQQIVCRVTHVDSYDKFYVQLDVEKADLVENTIANYDVALLTPPSSENVIDGVHCTVKHEGKIYRAILQDVSDTSNIRAVLPDYGNTITTSIDQVMILPSELSVYYYQSLLCSLNNYTAESKTLMSVEELKTKLTGNKFIIYINYVDEITLVSTLYDCTTGQKIAIFEPDEGAYDEVSPMCMRAVFNYNFGMAYITHTENLNEFYLQKSTDGDKIAALLDKLYKFYEEGTPEDLTNFEVDGLCAAKSVDGNWYRATIVSIEESQVKVHFTDYGNSETVTKESIKKLDSTFYEPCALALVASLGLVAVDGTALAKLNEWTAEQEVQVTLSFGSDGWLASLHRDGLDLAHRLINDKLAAPAAPPPAHTPAAAPAGTSAHTPAEQAPPPAGTAQAYVSHIDTPGHFWLQMADRVDDIEEIQAKLRADADSYPELEARDTGDMCVAKYLADEQWYRAEILDADADITTVRFVDYGNTDVLDNRPGLLKRLPDELKAIERLAVKSSVNAVPTGTTGEWSEAAGEEFTRLVGDPAVAVDALVVLKDVTTYVELYAGGEPVTERLVAGGHAARPDAPDCGDLPACFASHVNSPSEFWIQLATAAGELQAMETAMEHAEQFPELERLAEGEVCAARYPEDGAWYRAQVVAAGSRTEVVFSDYGNASIADELRALPAELRARPPLSRKCALQKPRDVRAWSRKSELRFNELAAEGATVFNVQFIASGDISIVELYLDGKSVTEELVELCCEEAPPAERPAPLGQDLSCDAKICYVQSLDEFYVHEARALPDIDRVTEALAAAADFESAAELKVGSVCAAFWAEDEQWYRARILESCDVGHHVLFIDYGNKAKCEQFKQLPEELVTLEPLAKCCRLAGVPEDNSLNEAGRNELDRLAVEDVTLRIEFLDSVKEPTLVKIILDGKDLISTLKPDAAEKVEIDTVAAVDEQKEKNDEKLESTESEQTAEVKDNEPTPAVDEQKHAEVKQSNTDEPEQTEEIEEAEETNNVDLNESFESNHTVIENTSFEGKEDTLSEAAVEIVDKVETPTTPEKDDSTDTLESSNDTIKTPEREESKDSITSDTGYTSSIDKSFEKESDDSPKKQEPVSPVKDTKTNEKDTAT